MLLETGELELVESNYWNNTFWGVSLQTGRGENQLERRAFLAARLGQITNQHLAASPTVVPP